MSSLGRLLNIFVTWLISFSLGTRSPEAARSVRPVNSSTHSRTTDCPGIPAPTASARLSGLAGGVTAVVITSSFSSVRRVRPCRWPSSGSARFVRRGGLVDPTRGSRKREAKRCNVRGRRKPFRPRASVRYSCPANRPMADAATDPGG